MRRAKIVCTLGPASDDLETVEALIRAGMDVARLNFSHGDRADHERRLGLVREASRRTGKPVAILQDLQGPKIRTGPMQGGGVLLRAGDEVTVTRAEVAGSAERFSTTYEGFADDVSIGDEVLMADGRLRFEVVGKPAPGEVRLRVRVGGPLGSHKGINLPGTRVSAPSLTAKDEEDLAFGQALGVDYVALSFVRSAADVLAAKRRLGDVPLIAKIEKPEALSDLDAIAATADGLMVARGDLGVEVPLETVPLLQKEVIERTNAAGRIAVVATEMLESMVERPRPTRAEVSDVANAILDGADAVMLSAETATGRHPVEAVRTMAAIIVEVERSARFRATPVPPLARSDSYPVAVARAAVAAADQLGLATIVACTQTGQTALLVSEHRPHGCVILGLTPVPETLRRMALYWGVVPVEIPVYRTTDEMLRVVSETLIGGGHARCGETVVIASGVPGLTESTHQMTLHRL